MIAMSWLWWLCRVLHKDSEPYVFYEVSVEVE
jgi:hypothetical protein